MSLAPSPTHMVSLNKTPARAITLVEEVVKKLQPDHHILHVANSRTIGDLEMIMASLVVQPSLIICSSQWTADEQTRANSIATKINPAIEIINIPVGLDAREGGQAIIDFLVAAVKSRGSEISLKYGT